MRRAAPTMPVSPRLLKHLAAATLAITTCIAIFADGSTTEAVAETVKKNELKKAEVDIVGQRKLALKGLHVKTGGMSMNDPAPDGGGGSSYYEGPIIPPSYGGLSGQRSSRPEDFLPGGDKAKKAREAAKLKKPTPEELAKLQEASRQRTGASAIN